MKKNKNKVTSNELEELEKLENDEMLYGLSTEEIKPPKQKTQKPEIEEIEVEDTTAKKIMFAPMQFIVYILRFIFVVIPIWLFKFLLKLPVKILSWILMTAVILLILFALMWYLWLKPAFFTN